MAVDILTKPSDAVFKAGVPKKLFVINVVVGAVPGGQTTQRNSYDVMKDGQRFLLNAAAVADGTPNVRSSITVVLKSERSAESGNLCRTHQPPWQSIQIVRSLPAAR
jgi:hypothetical protein